MTDNAVGDSITVSPGVKPRNQTACDLCRARKVRVWIHNTPGSRRIDLLANNIFGQCTYESDHQRCRGCESLDVDCTHVRPRRKRGPPNRSVQHPSVPTGWLSAFAPETTIMRLLGDWFHVIHPLAPTLLRRRFLRQLGQGVANTDAEFCGLVISVCAATKATLPRNDYGQITVDYCVDFLDAHGLLKSQFARDSFSINRCIALYNMGTAMSATAKSGLGSMRAYHALSEAAAGARYLAYYHIHEHDEVEQQLLRRLIWLLFASACSADIFGRLPISLLSQDRMESFPRPLPLTDDQMEPQCLNASDDLDQGPAWHGDETSYVPGLNSLSDLFLIWQQVQQNPQSTDPQACIMKYLAKVQHVLDNLPPELRWRGGLSRPKNVTEGHDVQIANLFVTSLNIRSNILQKLGPTEESAQEHQRIVDDLLEILYHLPHAVFDANGSSLVPKIRDIGAAFLEQTQLGNNVGQLEMEAARTKLERLLRKLDDLDCWQGIGEVDLPPLRV
ncbi:hypothetical protein FGSG_11056 [Fusarium graminearum PH-1]|uniref:Transcription factor domain-containing protein n=1 Tax=Gibberella zeae (strain ATCC MYA-4620 / CBS 123657 / FGSC 9075 / NRRL 31084 / PH-1) TaxID=229533 RepID=I1S2Q6_GIBZE|nr:hypothetical protein FGSG_11056 [Fusarium graminearum PH-1]ESU17681.1 hypothetical protein FGSG_11056 [Fusarium graminearum PH-1]|eukprot:XP_011325303.1 hypothetical protein FGSG_11056 [Fusarium graminearum PH-1]